MVKVITDCILVMAFAAATSIFMAMSFDAFHEASNLWGFVCLLCAVISAAMVALAATLGVRHWDDWLIERDYNKAMAAYLKAHGL